MRKVGSARKRPAGGVKWDEQNLEENEVIKATISKVKIDEPKTPYHGPLGEEHMDDMDGGLQPLELDGPNHHHQEPSTATNHLHPNQQPTTAASAGASALQQPAGAATEAVTGAAMDVDAGLGGGGAANGQAAAHQPSTANHPIHPIIPNHHTHHGVHAHFEEPAAQSPQGPSGGPSAAGGASRGDIDSGGGAGGSGTSAAAVSELEAYRSGWSSDSDRRASLTGGSDGDSEEARRRFAQRRKAHYNMRAALRRARLLLSEDGEGGSDGGDSDGLASEGGAGERHDGSGGDGSGGDGSGGGGSCDAAMEEADGAAPGAGTAAGEATAG